MATVAQALAAIRARAVAAGHNPTNQQVLDTYNRDLARGNTLDYIVGGSPKLPASVLSAGRSAASTVGGVSTPLQLTTPSASGPVVTGDSTTNAGNSMATGLASIPPNVLLLGGAALVVVLLLRKK